MGKKVTVRFKVRDKEITFVVPYGSYFIENWGSPFVIVFMFLLVSAAFFLAYGNENFANELAVYAYYFLVIGVFLQFVSYILFERKRRK